MRYVYTGAFDTDKAHLILPLLIRLQLEILTAECASNLLSGLDAGSAKDIFLTTQRHREDPAIVTWQSGCVRPLFARGWGQRGHITALPLSKTIEQSLQDSIILHMSTSFVYVRMFKDNLMQRNAGPNTYDGQASPDHRSHSRKETQQLRIDSLFNTSSCSS